MVKVIGFDSKHGMDGISTYLISLSILKLFLCADEVEQLQWLDFLITTSRIYVRTHWLSKAMFAASHKIGWK